MYSTINTTLALVVCLLKVLVHCIYLFYFNRSLILWLDIDVYKNIFMCSTINTTLALVVCLLKVLVHCIYLFYFNRSLILWLDIDVY